MNQGNRLKNWLLIRLNEKNKMNKLILLSLIVALSACHSNEQNEMTVTPKATADSAKKEVQSEIDRIVNELAPPDSSYTGDFYQKYDNGVVKVKGYFRFGKRHGQWFYFYPNGQIWSEAFYDNGLNNGFSKVHYESGKVYYEGGYKMNKPIGNWNFYDTTGTLVLQRSYDSTGKLLGDKKINPDQLK